MLFINLVLVYYFDSCHLLGHKVVEDLSDTQKIMLVWLLHSMVADKGHRLQIWRA